MIKERDLSILYNLADYISEEESIDWNVVTKKPNTLTSLVFSMTTDEDKMYSSTIGSIRDVALRKDKRLIDKFVIKLSIRYHELNTNIDMNKVLTLIYEGVKSKAYGND